MGAIGVCEIVESVGALENGELNLSLRGSAQRQPVKSFFTSSFHTAKSKRGPSFLDPLGFLVSPGSLSRPNFSLLPIPLNQSHAKLLDSISNKLHKQSSIDCHTLAIKSEFLQRSTRYALPSSVSTYKSNSFAYAP